MKAAKIYNCALKLLNEPSGTGCACSGCSDAGDDLAERAPYILAAAVDEMRDADDEYRRSHGLGARVDICDIMLPPEAEFPLSPRFAHAAAYYLASMLIADENPELADTLFDRFSDAMATIRASVPATKGKIRTVYP